MPRKSRFIRFVSRGFTLVELLVVVAVLGVLASILLPVIGSMVDRSRMVKATSNIRSLVQAQNLYANDHRGFYTPFYKAPVNTTTWQAALLPYLYDVEGTNQNMKPIREMGGGVYQVPEVDSRDPEYEYAKSIALNWSLYGGPSGGGGWFGNRQNVPRPGSIILLGEIEPRNTDSMVPFEINGAHPGLRRDGGTKALIGFCDGHVEALTAAELAYQGVDKEENPWRWW
ncbi:prepilin-type N-terminal cleavage/methylation domain-containing protein [Puniceicoccus vermicola]|uniref:Prepilin-type N-terminal cleavage/methylation domain-containing protein n=1 Tax=Puniceicoccus vermicola TaxID=388746 RepID=A0A7X1E3B3_9BACT|nr:prepilin-type N-terminal cleavage/methylation domain-containing protein [Puniceicoccus vermicola]MBC2600798.1 prepilin-type N-terminal cleavage/methylation domain-containing protein [Puniceicoccus vermicola]